MARGILVRLHGAAFGRGANLHLDKRFSAAASYAWERTRDGVFERRLTLPSALFGACMLIVAGVLTAGRSNKSVGTACLIIPIGVVVFFLMWLLVGLFRFDPGPTEGRVEVRDDALLCRFNDGILADLPWSEVFEARPGATESEVLIEHGLRHGRRETTSLRGNPTEIAALRAEIVAAIDNYLPVEVANRVLRNDGKPIRDWLASVRSRFAPGAYRAGPPPLTRDQLVHLLLSPQIDAEVRIAAAAAVSVLDGERAGMSRVRIVMRQMESPALRIATERALDDALDEAALAEAAAEAPGARVNQG